jgi:hypothetical protein
MTQWTKGDASVMPNHTIEFVNRDFELDQICSPGSRRFIVLDGATGFGKTDLLHKVRERYEASRRPVWRGGYIDLKTDPQFADRLAAISWPSLANAIIGALPGSGPSPSIPSGTDEEGIANVLVPYLAGLGCDVLLLFDGVEVLPLETSAWLERLVRHIDEGLKITGRALRAIFAGRYVRDWGHSHLFPLFTVSLSPFDRVAVTDMIKQVTDAAGTELDPSFVDELAWWVLYVSGGHPQGICDILRVVSTIGFVFPSLEYTFLRQVFSANGSRGTLLELCIEPIIDQILTKVPQQLHRVLKDISPIRRFDADLLDLLLKRKAIDDAGGQSGWELIRALTRTHLIREPTEADPMYRDQILRRMLAVQSRLSNPGRHQQIQEHAQGIFHQWALGQGPPGAQVRRVAIIESLHHLLQTEPQSSTAAAVQARLEAQLEKYVTNIASPIHKMQLKDALCNDQELTSLIEHRAGTAAIPALLSLIDRYI